MARGAVTRAGAAGEHEKAKWGPAGGRWRRAEAGGRGVHRRSAPLQWSTPSLREGRCAACRGGGAWRRRGGAARLGRGLRDLRSVEEAGSSSECTALVGLWMAARVPGASCCSYHVVVPNGVSVCPAKVTGRASVWALATESGNLSVALRAPSVSAS